MPSVLTSKESRRAGRLLAAAIVPAAIVAAAPAAGARSFVVKARGSQTSLGSVRAIGDFKPADDPTLRGAIRAFGEPTSATGGGEICRVRWAGIGVRIRFQNFGGRDSCKPRGGHAQKAVLIGDRRWRTPRGLHLGDRLRKLTRLYPRARRTPFGYRIVAGVLPFGEPQPYAVLGARIADRRVRAFTLFIGAAGD